MADEKRTSRAQVGFIGGQIAGEMARLHARRMAMLSAGVVSETFTKALRERVAAINSWAFTAIAESVEPRLDFAGIIVRHPGGATCRRDQGPPELPCASFWRTIGLLATTLRRSDLRATAPPSEARGW